MPRALMWLNLYGREAVRRKLKNRKKKDFLFFLGCFWAYVGQPHDHIGWAGSILLIQGPIHDIFAKFFWELAVLKITVFLSRPWKQVKVSWLNFDDYHGFQLFFTQGKHCWNVSTNPIAITRILPHCPMGVHLMAKTVPSYGFIRQ